ncbi:MAG: TetR/AcrR family transcriptional regulator [Reyranella sp.]|uniref:TetR/AcrR family transcriptional regulator n=1 Tax=Reyranella sp. TaxID=1929291 RepID=UPI00120CC5D5|nr:TetR/AcrR family transcriptional regulator [Reyranella sp.]TAJ88953.1 MAG: TetR/AcrR family transcriptional regulator [Reyranella sp.]
MPRYLTEQDIANFRAELCRVATERFARFGYEGVTMRQLAEALGCSPKTPYRYFKDKADILATVRAQAFSRFADVLEAAAAKGEGALDKARLVGDAYLRFADEHPHAYRIMFEIDQPIGDDHPDLLRESKRARTFVTRQAEEMVKAGLIDADPLLFGWSMWAATHGLVMLKQAGMLDHGPDVRTLAGYHGALMFKGALAAPKKTGKKQ